METVESVEAVETVRLLRLYKLDLDLEKYELLSDNWKARDANASKNQRLEAITNADNNIVSDKTLTPNNLLVSTLTKYITSIFNSISAPDRFWGKWKQICVRI